LDAGIFALPVEYDELPKPLEGILIDRSGRYSFTYKCSTDGGYELLIRNRSTDPVAFTLTHLTVKDVTGLGHAVDSENNITFVPDVLSYTDYYPFGMLIPERHGNSESYRYGFGGHEKIDE
jgi:hypothetical protein